MRPVLLLLTSMLLLACSSAPSAQTSPPAVTPVVPPSYTGDKLEQWLSWSEPNQGVSARIEYLVPPRLHDGGELLVRIKNVGDQPVTVPVGKIRGAFLTRCFNLYRWDDGRWLPVFWPNRFDHNYRAEPSTIQLQPGRSTIFSLDRELPASVMASSHIKVAIHLPGIRMLRWVESDDFRDNSEGAFQGSAKPGFGYWDEAERMTRIELTTPPFPTHFNEAMHRQRLGRYPGFEAWLDQFTPVESIDWHAGIPQFGPPNPIYLSRLLSSSNVLKLYRPEDVQSGLDPLLSLPNVEPHWRLKIAALAARAGSGRGRSVINHAIAYADGELLRSGLYALGFVLDESKGTDAWAVRSAVDALADRRPMNHRPRAKTVADLAYDDYRSLAHVLGRHQCRQAVPALIERVRATNGTEQTPIDVLEKMNDPRAEPVLLEVLRRRLADGTKHNYSRTAAIRTVGNLRIKQAVPLLIKHVDEPGVATALGHIGDRSAIPALQQLANRGDVDALISLYRMGETTVLQDLKSILRDPSQSTSDRTDVIHALRTSEHAWFVPQVIRIIHEENDGSLTILAIRALADRQTSETVAGLIRCFDVDFSDRPGWKGAYEPEHFRWYLAEALSSLTGQTFGNNPDAWRKWWQQSGKKQMTLR